MAFPRGHKNPRAPWNRKWGMFGRKKKRIPLRRLSTVVARKRKEWGWLYVDRLTLAGIDPPPPEVVPTCGIRCIEWGLECNTSNEVRIPLITKEMLAEFFQDNVTIARMQGAIQWRPKWDTSLNPCSSSMGSPVGVLAINDRMNGYHWPIHMRAALVKGNSSNQDGITEWDPQDADDWTDHTGWLREWQHTWFPEERLNVTWSTPFANAGICSNTTRAAYTMTETDGNMNVNVPAISTSCNIVPMGEGCTVQEVTYTGRPPPWWTMSLNRSRPIDLKEDDDLSIFVNWNQPRPYEFDPPIEGINCDEDCPPADPGSLPCGMYFSIALKVQYQYG